MTVPERVRVVLYAHASSPKAAQMLNRWSGWGFRPVAVVVEFEPEPSLATRLRDKIYHEGVMGVIRGVVRRLPAGGNPSVGDQDAESLDEARRVHGIAVIRVESLTAAEGLEAVKALHPDLAIHAGAGIMRAPLLSIPRLGTLNAHMGILPFYRGVNVSEWAAFRGDPVGCTVHLIDPGIDTGDILRVATVSLDGISSIRELRRAIDRRQIELLGEVVRRVMETGQLPLRLAQAPYEGKQHFRMHPDLREILTRRLSRPAVASGVPTTTGP